MKIEYEAMFMNINKEEIISKLKEIGAELVKPETLMKRKTYWLPKELEEKDGYFRVRDEDAGKITMTLKLSEGTGIESDREAEIEVKDFEQACNLVENLGMKQKAFQETKREIWELDGVEIMIDTWPFIPTYIEVEGKSEEEVKEVSEKLGFDWGDAKFGTSVVQAAAFYGISAEDINNKIPKIIFDMENPFEKFKREFM